MIIFGTYLALPTCKSCGTILKTLEPKSVHKSRMQKSVHSSVFRTTVVVHTNTYPTTSWALFWRVADNAVRNTDGTTYFVQTKYGPLD